MENIKDYSKSSFNAFINSLSSVKIEIYGDMFNYKTLNGLYLSSSNTEIPNLTTLNIFSEVESVSSRYPAITVLPVEKYTVKENYILEFYLPNNLLIGNYDIIYINEAGYFKASDSKRFTYFRILS